MPEFNYSNLPVRPSGRYLRVASKLLPGVRKVQQQVVPYALSWEQHNAHAVAGDDPLWVVLGDSMSQGIGAKQHDQGWVGQLAKLFEKQGKKYRIINLSMTGARIRDVLDRQLPELTALGTQPDLVTVMVGSNDLVRKREYQQSALNDFDELLEKVPEGSVVANLLGNRDIPRAMDDRLQRAVADRNLRIADIRRQGPKTWVGMTAEDHFHPNEVGYREIARVFQTAIDS